MNSGYARNLPFERSKKDLNDNSSILTDVITTLEARVTILECENSELTNSVIQSKQKIEILEMEIERLKLENYSFKQMLIEMKEEINNFTRNFGVDKADKNEIRERNASNRPCLDHEVGITEIEIKKEKKGESINNNNKVDEVKEIDLSKKEKIEYIASLGLNTTYNEGKYLSTAHENCNIIEEEKTTLNRTSKEFPPTESESDSAEDSSHSSNENKDVYEGYRKFTFYKKPTPTPPNRTISIQQKDKGEEVELNREMSLGAEVFVPLKLFENFLIIGTTKEDDIEKSFKSKRQEVSLLGAEILFNFAESAQLPENVLIPHLEEFIAPKGVKLIKIDDTKMRDDLFKKNLNKEERKYRKRIVSPFPPQPHEISQLKWGRDVEAFNPQKKLYAICIENNDFLILKKTNKNKNRFIKMNTLYCFLTYYPIPKLMFNLLISILNLIKKKRRALYSDSKQEDKSKADFGSIKQIIFQEVLEYLKNLWNLPTPSPRSSINYFFNNDNEKVSPMEYKCMNQKDPYLELATWESMRVFQIFTLEDLKFIMSAIILEKNIAFFSRDVTLLHSVFSTLLGLIYPLRYMSKVISMLPNHLVGFCGSIVPVILGINRKEEYFWMKGLSNNSTCMFVFLEKRTIFIHEKNTEMENLPRIDFITEELEDLYLQINHNVTEFEVIRDAELLKSKQDHATNNIPENPIVILKIFNKIRNWMENNIISCLCRLKSDQNQLNDFQGNVDLDKIVFNQHLRNFFNAFKMTEIYQGFSYAEARSYQKLSSF